jgi:4-hydroxy-tetrahydrodipicolinate reductase
MRNPFRVIVWGPGRLGAICIRETTLNPALELVGVRAYSASKNGVDAGELLGIGSIGIKASTDVEALLKIECDAIIYSALDMGRYHTDDEIIRLLEAGRNVITTLPYQHLEAVRDAAFIARLEAACQKGRSVFHATGVDPDTVCDRVLPALTTMCTDIRHVQIQENWDVGAFGVQTLGVIGFGQPREAVEAAADSLAFGDNYGRMVTHAWARMMGMEYDRRTVERVFPLAPQDIETPSGLVIPKGTVCCYTTRWSGWVDRISRDKPFFQIEYNWHAGGKAVPAHVKADVTGWVLSIEGRPSIRTVIDMKTDFETRGRYVLPGNPNFEASYHAIAAPCLQAIPHVVKAKPGILPVFHYPHHWVPDLRTV